MEGQTVTMSKIYERDNNTVALIDGQLYYYDACSAFRDVYNPEVFDYIGQGAIYSYRGIPRNTEEQKHFWRYKDRTLLQPAENVVQ